MHKSNTKQEGKWTKNKGNLWESVRKDEQVCWKVALAEWWGFWRAAMISLLNWISLKCQERKTVAETKWKRGEYQTSAVRRDQPAVGCVLKHWLRWHTHTHSALSPFPLLLRENLPSHATGQQISNHTFNPRHKNLSVACNITCSKCLCWAGGFWLRMHLIRSYMQCNCFKTISKCDL